MKKLFTFVVFIISLALVACGDQSNLDKLDGKWDGGVFTVEISADKKLMRSLTPFEDKNLSFNVYSDVENDITLALDDGTQVEFTVRNEFKIVMFEKNTGKKFTLTRIK